MNPAPQDDLDKRTLKKIIRIMFPQYPANHPYHGFTPTSKKRINKMIALIHQERSRAVSSYKKVNKFHENAIRIDELEKLPKIGLGKLANHSIKVDLHVRDRIATLNQKEQE